MAGPIIRTYKALLCLGPYIISTSTLWCSCIVSLLLRYGYGDLRVCKDLPNSRATECWKQQWNLAEGPGSAHSSHQEVTSGSCCRSCVAREIGSLCLGETPGSPSPSLPTWVTVKCALVSYHKILFWQEKGKSSGGRLMLQYITKCVMTQAGKDWRRWRGSMW